MYSTASLGDKKQLSAADVLGFFSTLQKLVETNSCGQKVNKRPTLCCASVEKRRSTQSDCITSGFLQDKLSLLWTVSSSCIVFWGGWSLLFMCLTPHPEYAEAKFYIAHLNSWFWFGVWVVWCFFYWQERKTYRVKNTYFKNSIVFVKSESIL